MLNANLSYEANNVLVLNIQPLIVVVLAGLDVGLGTLLELRNDIEPVVSEIVKATSIVTE